MEREELKKLIDLLASEGWAIECFQETINGFRLQIKHQYDPKKISFDGLSETVTADS